MWVLKPSDGNLQENCGTLKLKNKWLSYERQET